MKRWCVKARDGWHYAVPNKKPDPQLATVGIACGTFVVLPFGAEKREATCEGCRDAVRAR